MITKLGFKRLYRLCEYMERLPKSADKHFHMLDFYLHTGGGHRHRIPQAPTVKDLHTCGTTACALGWAMTVPSLRKAGLHKGIGNGGVMGTLEVFGVDLFDEEWGSLFGADHQDTTPRAWAKRVRRLLKTWEKDSRVTR